MERMLSGRRGCPPALIGSRRRGLSKGVKPRKGCLATCVVDLPESRSPSPVYVCSSLSISMSAVLTTRKAFRSVCHRVVFRILAEQWAEWSTPSKSGRYGPLQIQAHDHYNETISSQSSARSAILTTDPEWCSRAILSEAFNTRSSSN